MYEVLAIISCALFVIGIFLGYLWGTKNSWGVPITHLDTGVCYKTIDSGSFNFLEFKKENEKESKIYRISKNKIILPENGKFPDVFIAVDYLNHYYIFPTEPHFIFKKTHQQGDDGIITLSQQLNNRQMKIQQYYQIGSDWIPIDLPIEKPESLSEAVWMMVKSPTKRILGLLRSKLVKEF